MLTEGAIVSEFYRILLLFKELGFDLDYMNIKLSNQPVHIDGSKANELNSDESAGCWTNQGYIQINPDIESVKKHFGLDAQSDEEFIRSVIAHELAHEIWRKSKDEDFKSAVLDLAELVSFNTPYLETVDKEHRNEETFCEYMSYLVNTY